MEVNISQPQAPTPKSAEKYLHAEPSIDRKDTEFYKEEIRRSITLSRSTHGGRASHHEWVVVFY